MNVTVRCGLGGVVLFALLPPDRDDISGVVSVELDAIVVRGLNLSGVVIIGQFEACAIHQGYHRRKGAIMALP